MTFMNRTEICSYMKDFRRYVEGYKDFLIIESHKLKRNNYWNCICSAMDWIQVATEYLATHTIKKDNTSEMSIQLFTYISCIDIIWESIWRLHKIFIDPKTKPYTGDSSIFQNNRLNSDDNQYFSHIRAAFGAHPVNIQEKINTNGKSPKKDKYASWSSAGIYKEFDFCVNLYSDDAEPDIVFGFREEQLEHFLSSRYQYLSEIKKEICNKHLEHKDKMASIAIKESDNSLDQLQILMNENNIRLNSDYYKDIISSIERFYKTVFIHSENDDMIFSFEKRLKTGIKEIFDSLQSLEKNELAIDSLLHPDTKAFPSMFNYAFSKLSSYELGVGHTPTEYFIDNIINGIEPYICPKYNSYGELYWLTIIAINISNGEL